MGFNSTSTNTVFLALVAADKLFKDIQLYNNYKEFAKE